MTTENQANQVPSNQSTPLYYMPIQSLETIQGSQNVQNVQPTNNNSVDGSNNIIININKGYLKSFVYGLAIVGSAYALYKFYKNGMFDLNDKSYKLERNVYRLAHELRNLQNYISRRTDYIATNEYKPVQTHCAG